MTGRIQAAYMLAPLVMDLADHRIPLKIVSLGHRSGAVIMVRTNSRLPQVRRPARQADRDPEPLRGRLPVPAQDAGRRRHDARTTSRSSRCRRPTCRPRCTPRTIDAYCTGEPFGAAAQRAGYARPLAMTRDEWRNYICCVLTVREDLIRDQRPLVQDLVNHVQAAGSWLDAGAASTARRRCRSPPAATSSTRIRRSCAS